MDADEEERQTWREQHRRDVSLLKLVLADPDFGGERRAAFDDMLERVETHPTWTLTEKQRAWAREEADRLGLSEETPSQRNRGVPRGREVERAAVLRVLPKSPPGRRAC